MRALTLTLALVAFATSLPAAAAPLNDTGIQFCGAYPSGNTAAPCVANPTGQDERFGRDAAAEAGALPAKTGAGAAGFDFTKIANDGSVLPASAALNTAPGDWGCTRDNVTGLVWEVKTDDGGPRDKDNGYTNYDDPTQQQKWGGSGYVNPTQAEIDAASNSVGYVNAVNALTGANRLCGATDWRRPSKQELLSIVHYGRVNPAIDPDYFPNTPGGYFWSGSPYAGSSSSAWYVYFSDGYAYFVTRGSNNHVRLVRGGQ